MIKFEDLDIGETFNYLRHDVAGHPRYAATKVSSTQWRNHSNGAVLDGFHAEPREIVYRFNNTSKGMKSMLKSISSDIRGYISSNKEVLYTVALVLLIDQYVFEGAFRERLKSLIDGLLKKAESSITPKVE